jgi:hypothetical protein
VATWWRFLFFFRVTIGDLTPLDQLLFSLNFVSWFQSMNFFDSEWVYSCLYRPWATRLISLCLWHLGG